MAGGTGDVAAAAVTNMGLAISRGAETQREAQFRGQRRKAQPFRKPGPEKCCHLNTCSPVGSELNVVAD